MSIVKWRPKKNNLIKSIVDVPTNNLFAVDFANRLPYDSYIVQPKLGAKTEWNNDPDFMQHIPDKILYGDYFLIFDSSAEAMCPLHEYQYWNAITNNYKKYNINPKRIIYLSCNLRDNYTAINNKIDFWVYSEIFWQNYCLKEWNLEHDTNKAFEAAVSRTLKTHGTRYYSYLNKNNQRPARSYLTYQLDMEGLHSYGLINQNKIPMDQQKYFDFDINTYNKSLPIHIDEYSATSGDNTNHNWIFDQTLFHIVGESSQSVDHEKVLISEKYFKPIANFTPFIVYGDPLVNRLYTLAQDYKSYRPYFKIGFEENWKTKAKQIAAITSETCMTLSKMSFKQRVDWKFKEETLLKHNYKTFLANQYNIETRQRFLEGLTIDSN